MKAFGLMLACSTAVAQTSATSPVLKSPGDTVTLEIAATSQPNKAPLTLHFDVVFPVLLMELDGEGEAGRAALSSGKSLQCHTRNPHAYACVLSGGDHPIQDGQIAVFHFRVRNTARSGPAALRVESAVSSTVDSKIFSLNDTEAIVMIR